MTESSAKRTRADARTVIADLLYQHHTGGDIVSADDFLEALRSHGYAVVPVEPTDLMMDQGTDPLFWPTFLPSHLVREVWMWMLYGASAISKEQMEEIKARIRHVASAQSSTPDTA